MGFRRDWQDMRNMLNWRSVYAVKTKQIFLLRFSSANYVHFCCAYNKVVYVLYVVSFSYYLQIIADEFA